jgi:hypothetical protein
MLLVEISYYFKANIGPDWLGILMMRTSFKYHPFCSTDESPSWEDSSQEVLRFYGTKNFIIIRAHH